MNSIVVTGATSMIGVALIQSAISQGTEVYAVIRPDTRRLGRLPQSPLLHIVYGRLDRLDAIEGLPDHADVFYHLAWSGTNKTDRNDPCIHEMNIRYTLDAVKVAHRLGCDRFVGAGSQAEYGQVSSVISASTATNPETAYGISKLSACLLSRLLCDQLNMRHIWTRIFSVYGTNDNEGTMINYAIDSFISGKTARFSAATQIWNYLFETDAGMYLYFLGKNDVESGVYCVANPESKILKEYINILCDVYGSNAQCVFSEQSTSSAGLLVDVEKTVSVTGYYPKTSFREGILTVINARKGKAL